MNKERKKKTNEKKEKCGKQWKNKISQLGECQRCLVQRYEYSFEIIETRLFCFYLTNRLWELWKSWRHVIGYNSKLKYRWKSILTWQIPSRSKYCCFLKRWSVSPPGNSEAATERERERERVRERECVWETERECVCVCLFGRER